MGNKLIHGDSLEYLKSIKPESINAIITDPPYGYLKHKLDCPFDYKRMWKLAYNILKNNSFLLFFGRGEMLAKWIVYSCDIGFGFKEELIWHKKNPSNFLNFPRNHESASLLVKGKKKVPNVYIDKIDYNLEINPSMILADFKRILGALKKEDQRQEILDYLDHNEVNYKQIAKHKHGLTVKEGFRKASSSLNTYKSYDRGRKLSSILCVKKEQYNYRHPTQKPLKLIKQLIELTTEEGDLILDPFCGSGTTAVACLELNRNYLCIEKELDYYNIAKERIENYQNNLNL